MEPFRGNSSLTASKRVYIIGLGISLLAFFLYSPVLHYGFFNIDDHLYVYENPHLRDHNATFALWSLTTFKAGNWHPLTWVSLAVDYYFWGTNPMGYHLTNIILHCFNIVFVTVIVFKIATLYRSNHNIIFSWGKGNYELTIAVLTAAGFGLHPLRVQSVVWIAERKDVLYAFFYLLSILCYISYADQRSGKKAAAGYIASLSAFLFSLMAKSMAVTLPLVFIILDVFCLRRSYPRNFAFREKIVIEKLPFLFLSFTVSILAIAAQASSRSILKLDDYSLALRAFNAVYSIWFYAYKTIIPAGLSQFYPLPHGDFLIRPWTVFSLIFVIAASICCIVAFKRRSYFWIGACLYYLVTLLPVLGIIQVGNEGTADRFSYLPSLGLTLLISTGVVWGIRRMAELTGQPWEKAHYITIAVVIALMIALSVSTDRQIRVWRDSLSVWDRAVEVCSNESETPYILRAFSRLERNELGHALRDCSHALLINPKSEGGLMCRAEVYEKTGRDIEALRDYNTVLSL